MPSIAALRENMSRRGIAPATLNLAEAAAYVGLSVNTFRKEIVAGTMPAPLPLKSGRKLFSRAALDRATGSQQTAPQVSQEQEIAAAIDAYDV